MCYLSRTRTLLLAYAFVLVALRVGPATMQYSEPRCGPYGFVCAGPSRLRLCSSRNGTLGAGFVCPRGLRCVEQWPEVCADEAAPWAGGAPVQCRRGERVPDPSVPECKGYMLCMPVNKRMHAIRFNCTGVTVFNPLTRTCSAPHAYRCPPAGVMPARSPLAPGRPVFCEDYKLRMSAELDDFTVQYFCPKAAPAGGPLLCTVLSANFCLTLERDDVDVARRKPRLRLSPPPSALPAAVRPARGSGDR